MTAKEEALAAELRKLRAYMNPPNAFPFHVHAGKMGDDAWLTLCGRRVPRSTISCDLSATCPWCVAEGARLIEESDVGVISVKVQE